MSGFQKVVNDQQAPAVKGDFASTNPFASILAGPGALVAPAGGLLVGNFAWVGPAGQVSQSFVAGYQIGFLGRNEQALITQFLGENTLLVPQGFPVTLFNEGDFWAQFEAGATVGQLVFADPNNGAPLAGATAPAGATSTASAGFTGTATVTNGSTTLTVNTATAGILSPGDVITSTNVPANTTIVSQLTVTAGSGAGLLGTYQMSAAATAGSGPQAITSVSTMLNNTADLTGALNFGDVISGTGVTVGTTVGLQQPGFSGVASTVVGTNLTVTSVTPGAGPLLKGAGISGGTIPAATTIASQTSGTPGGVGVYVLSAAATAIAAGVVVQDNDTPGGVGQYTLSVAQNFASTTVTVAGTSQPTGFKVRGTYSPLAGEIGKISTL
jgi:hypothetical protein